MKIKLLGLILLFVPSAYAEDVLKVPAGQTLVAVGGGWDDSFQNYVRTTGHLPQGVKFWCSFQSHLGGESMQQPETRENRLSFFWHHAKMCPPGGFLAITFNHDAGFPMRVTPSGPNKLRTFLDGSRDKYIEEYGEAFKEFGRPVFVDIGNEADYFHKGYPQEYVRMFRKVHDIWQRQGVRNVIYVWHVVFWDHRLGIAPYYPGDDYLDVCAISYYETDLEPLPPGLLADFVRAARSKQKMVAVFESGIPGKRRGSTWEGYYGRLFRFVEDNDVRLLVYNNFKGTPAAAPDGPDKSGINNLFARSQISDLPQDVQQRWIEKTKLPRYNVRLPGDISVRPMPKLRNHLATDKNANTKTAEMLIKFDEPENLESIEKSGRFRVQRGLGIEFLPGKLGDTVSTAVIDRRFTYPLLAEFKVSCLADGLCDVWPEALGTLRFHWGTGFNTRSLVWVGDDQFEIPHVKLTPGRQYGIVMTVDERRVFTISVDGQERFRRLVPEGVSLDGPVVLGGGIGHVVYRSVHIKGKVIGNDSQPTEKRKTAPIPF